MTTAADIPGGDRPPGAGRRGRHAGGTDPGGDRPPLVAAGDGGRGAVAVPHRGGPVRLAAHLTASVTAALAGEPADAWGGLGLSEEQHRRIGDYLVGVCWAADLPDERIAQVRRAVAPEIPGLTPRPARTGMFARSSSRGTAARPPGSARSPPRRCPYTPVDGHRTEAVRVAQERARRRSSVSAPSGYAPCRRTPSATSWSEEITTTAGRPARPGPAGG